MHGKILMYRFRAHTHTVYYTPVTHTNLTHTFLDSLDTHACVFDEWHGFNDMLITLSYNDIYANYTELQLLHHLPA